MIRSPLLLAAAAALLPAASTDKDPLRDYAVAGPPTRCLADNDLQPVILDQHRVGLYRTGKRWWISEIQDCPSLEPLSTLIIERFGGPLCDTDRFRVLEPGVTIPSAYCRFSPFVPYDRVAKRR